MFTIENELGVQFEGSEFARLDSVGELEQVLAEKLGPEKGVVSGDSPSGEFRSHERAKFPDVGTELRFQLSP